MKRIILIVGLCWFCAFGKSVVVYSVEKDSIDIWIPETKIIVTDSDEVFVAGHPKSCHLNDTVVYKSSTLKVPIYGYAAIAMYYDNTDIAEEQELRRTHDEVVRIYKTSRRYTDAEEKEIVRVVIEYMRHKRLWVERLSPFDTGTCIVRSVRFDIRK